MSVETRSQDQVTEFTLPEGCPGCGADLEVRVTPGAGAQGVCLVCKSFSRPQVSMTHRGLKVQYAPTGEA